MSKYIAKGIIDMPSSGIREFFDVANMMKDAISLGVGEPDLKRRGMSEKRLFLPLKKALRHILLIPE